MVFHTQHMAEAQAFELALLLVPVFVDVWNTLLIFRGKQSFPGTTEIDEAVHILDSLVAFFLHRKCTFFVFVP